MELALAMKGSLLSNESEYSAKPSETSDPSDFSGASSGDHLASASFRWTRGQVLNSDAMQVYRGLDVITNKIPSQEQEGVEHCLMGFKDPGEQYVVGEFVHDALKIVSVNLL